jgi:micrococcal nuclease
MYEYNCIIVKVVDGDTVDVDIDLGFGMWMRNERVRVHGIDTPESRTRDKVEKVFGLAAKRFVQQVLKKGSKQTLVTEKPGDESKGKFGRILGKFKIYDAKTDSWDFMGNVMIREGHAVPYHGQSKDDIQEQHITNRQILLESGFVTKEEYDTAVAKMAK